MVREWSLVTQEIGVRIQSDPMSFRFTSFVAGVIWERLKGLVRSKKGLYSVSEGTVDVCSSRIQCLFPFRVTSLFFTANHWPLELEIPGSIHTAGEEKWLKGSVWSSSEII